MTARAIVVVVTYRYIFLTKNFIILLFIVCAILVEAVAAATGDIRHKEISIILNNLWTAYLFIIHHQSTIATTVVNPRLQLLLTHMRVLMMML